MQYWLIKLLFLVFLFSGNAYAEKFQNKEYNSTSFSWGFLSTSKKVFLEVENRNPYQNVLYTTFKIESKCSLDKKDRILEDTIILENFILKPYEIKKVYLDTNISNVDDMCAGLKFRESTFMRSNPGDPCINEKNFFKNKICKAKNVDWFEDDRLPRGEAADKCSRKSRSKPSEIRSQYYKDCMKDEGY